MTAGARGSASAAGLQVRVHAPAGPAESRSASYGATSTGAERTLVREHRSAGATTLAERISAGAHRSESGEGLRRQAGRCSWSLFFVLVAGTGACQFIAGIDDRNVTAQDSGPSSRTGSGGTIDIIVKDAGRPTYDASRARDTGIDSPQDVELADDSGPMADGESEDASTDVSNGTMDGSSDAGMPDVDAGPADVQPGEPAQDGEVDAALDAPPVTDAAEEEDGFNEDAAEPEPMPEASPNDAEAE